MERIDTQAKAKSLIQEAKASLEKILEVPVPGEDNYTQELAGLKEKPVFQTGTSEERRNSIGELIYYHIEEMVGG